MKERIISEVLFSHYFGIGQNQLPKPSNLPKNKREWKKFNKEGETPNQIQIEDTPANRKLLFHTIRMLKEAKRILKRKVPKIYVENDQFLCQILDKESPCDIQLAVDNAVALRDKIVEMKKNNNNNNDGALPAAVPVDVHFALSSLVVFLRSNF